MWGLKRVFEGGKGENWEMNGREREGEQRSIMSGIRGEKGGNKRKNPDFIIRFFYFCRSCIRRNI